MISKLTTAGYRCTHAGQTAFKHPAPRNLRDYGQHGLRRRACLLNIDWTKSTRRPISLQNQADRPPAWCGGRRPSEPGKTPYRVEPLTTSGPVMAGRTAAAPRSIYGAVSLVPGTPAQPG
jgi:hypothetical protein